MTKSPALDLHRKLKGKLTISSKLPLTTKKTLSMLYTPGVAQVVNYLSKNKEAVNELTIKRNTIAVVTDGSAVLGLGNVGPFAALPVMEGKCAIFKEFADLNAFPVCLNTQNSAKIVETIKIISPVFAAVNLEDISSPRCFEIEEKLQNIGIPVVHDDQHATAIAVLAALYNAAKVIKKDLRKGKIVIVGAGAAGTAITKLLFYDKFTDILIVDRQGIISQKRKNITSVKKNLAAITNKEKIDGDILTACRNADVLIGVSVKGLFTQKMIMAMNNHPIVFALSNPDPELEFNNAKKWGVKVFATGRSDLPNQINNCLVFPGFFKGLIKWNITKISNQMKVMVARSVVSLIPNPTANNFIPKIFDKRLVETITESLSYYRSAKSGRN